MTTVVFIEPSTFVDWMTAPGIRVDDFAVPVTKYMSANPAFGGNAAASELLGPLQSMKDSDGVKLIKKTKHFGRLMTGQGYFHDFCLVMQFVADHLDEVRRIKGAEKYFKPTDDARSVLQRMVKAGVFGMDCIGFVSQYLVSAGVWNEYKTYYPKDYFREFKAIKSLDDVGSLTLLIWGGHIAIVDKVLERGSSKSGVPQLTIDVCQSSDGTGITGAKGVSGPQRNARAIIALEGRSTEDRTLFRVVHPGSPVMPVQKPFWMANYRIDKLVPAKQALGI